MELRKIILVAFQFSAFLENQGQNSTPSATIIASSVIGSEFCNTFPGSGHSATARVYEYTPEIWANSCTLKFPLSAVEFPIDAILSFDG